jgi:hypothetical protein
LTHARRGRLGPNKTERPNTNWAAPWFLVGPRATVAQSALWSLMDDT